MSIVKRFLASKETLLPTLTLSVVLVVGWFAYAPGIKGSFLFDDWINLPPLGNLGPIDNWHSLVTYLLSGVASATGRPVAMLTFLLDANNWPASPAPFKYTNILIHILNGALLAWLSFVIAQVSGIDKRRAAWVATISSGMWLLHPLMVSTTLYVVQRMAMLAATFVLAGLLCYVHGRRLLVTDRAWPAYAWMSAGVALFGLLATLSKENGALTPLFALVIENIVLQHPRSSLRVSMPTFGWRVWRLVFLYTPLALLAVYLIARFPVMLNKYADMRNFTLMERLLTEARIVVHYLYVLLVPRAFTAGLFNDNISLSTGFLTPWTTAPSILLILLLLIVGWKIRHRQPALALAIYFYFCGQFLESTFIPLELYFEHRNYLPAVFLFFPLATWVVCTPRVSNTIRIAIATSLLAILASLTWSRATLWGHPFEQAVVWARENPTSPRAQTTLALHMLRRHNYEGATAVLKSAESIDPTNIMIQLNLLGAECAQSGIESNTLESAERALRTTKIGSRVAYNAIGRFIRQYESGRCPGLGDSQLAGLIQAALGNQHMRLNGPGWFQNMLSLKGELKLAQHEPRSALTLFKSALASAPNPSTALFEAALLGTAGHPGDGAALLDYFKTLPPNPTRGFNVAHLRALWLGHLKFYAKQIQRVRHRLLSDANKQNSSLPDRRVPRTVSNTAIKKYPPAG